jgi:hypothetical protein
MHISINFTGPEINDHVNPSDLERTQTRDHWEANSKLDQLNYSLELMVKLNCCCLCRLA